MCVSRLTQDVNARASRCAQDDNMCVSRFTQDVNARASRFAQDDNTCVAGSLNNRSKSKWDCKIKRLRTKAEAGADILRD